MDSPHESSVDGRSSAAQDAPYLSVVVAARNDDHGGNLLGRMQVFVDAWINQSKRHQLSSELIIVEWNPPAGRERLAKALRWPSDTGPCEVRIIEVPPEVHARYRQTAALPLYQMIAKNVGIRRARGAFILATNIDIVFSDELVQFLASRRLERGRMYRIDRYDVMSDVPMDGTLDEQLAYCGSHLIRVCAREGLYRLTQEGLRRNEEQDITRAESGIHFGRGWFSVERYGLEERFRWIENDAEVWLRVPAAGPALLLDLEPGPGVGPPPQPLQVFDANGSMVAEWSVSGRTKLQLWLPPAEDNSIRSFRLRVPDGGRPVVHDPRILNFRVFRCDWAEQMPRVAPAPLARVVREARPTLARLVANLGVPSVLFKGPAILRAAVRLLSERGDDIFGPGVEFWGKGWQYLERAGTERFRWVSQDAELVVRTTGQRRNLALLVEPGPGVGYRPFHLLITLANGEVVAQALVNGLTYVKVPIPAWRGRVTALFLTTKEGGLPVAGEPRILNFRIFGCGCAAGNAPSVSAEPEYVIPWTAVTVESRPTEIDWAAELKPYRRVIADMGRPVSVHTYACGDFTMMAREHWFDVRGYTELNQFYSMHLDSMLCYAAHHAGAREQLLPEPMRIYHIEHGAGSGWTPEGEGKLFARMSQDSIHVVSYQDLVALIVQMRTLHAPVIFNVDDWGLAALTFPETTLARTACGSETGR
jgi:hypothetical protein